MKNKLCHGASLILILFFLLPHTLCAKKQKPEFRRNISVMSEIDLKRELRRSNADLFLSGMQITRGILTTVSGPPLIYLGVLNYQLIKDSDPYIFPIAMFGYAFSAFLVSTGALMIPAGIVFTAAQLKELPQKKKYKHDVQMYLQHYHSLSYHAAPGYGFGVSVNL